MISDDGLITILAFVIAGMAWLLFDDFRSGRAFFSVYYTADRASAPKRFWMVVAAHTLGLGGLIFALVRALNSH